MVKKSFLKSSLTILAIVALVAAVFPIANVKAAAAKPSLTYSAHVQTYGDLDEIKASEELEELTDRIKGEPTNYVGTMGEAKRMEALTIAFDGIEGVSLKYQAHVQGSGWLTEVPVTKEGTTFAGTKGASKRLEALKITVVGLDKLTKAGYAIKYRAHVQGIGWQDWVTADDKSYDKTEEGFAGTVGQAKRIEAIEIAVVHVHQKGEYTYNGETEEGVAQHTMICPLCKERIVEDCTYSEWETSSGDSTSVTRACVCGHKETKKLKAVLNDETVTEVEVNKVDTTLTVPAGKTLTVDDELGENAVVTVKGTLVLKGTTHQSAQLKGNGTVIWAPEAETEAEFQQKCGKLADYLKSSTGVKGAGKTLKYEMRLPEMERPQKIETTNDSSPITIGEGYDITLDLGKNEFALNSGSSAKGLIINNADLTIKNGTLRDDVTANNEVSNYTLENKATGKLTLENVTINTKNRAIGTIGDLTISNSTIKGLQNKADVAVKIGDLASKGEVVADEMSKKTISLDNVKIEGFDNGIVTLAKNATVNLNDVDIVANGFALHTNASNPSTNNSYIVTGGSYKVTDKDATVAYLASTGKSIFTDCTLEGDNGVETSGTELTLDGATIIAKGKTYWNTGIETAKQGGPTGAGAAVLLRVCKNYGDKAGIKLVVKNSTLISTNGYAVNVAAGEELNPVVQKVNISYDTASYEELDGARGPQYVADVLKGITTTQYDVVEE